MNEEILAQIKGGEVCEQQILINISQTISKAVLNQQIFLFITDKIDFITESALFSNKPEEVNTKVASLKILTSHVSKLISFLLTSVSFLTKISDFSKKLASQEQHSISSWCKIMSALISDTSSSFLHFLPERKKLLKNLIPFLNIQSIYQLVFLICSDGHQQAVQFLEKYHASTVFFNALHDDETNMVEKLKLMSKMISSLDSAGPLVQSLSRRERIDYIFELAVCDDIHVSNAAMQLLFDISSHCDENDTSESSMFHQVFMHIIERVEELARFICSGDFSRGKDRAIDLVIGMIETVGLESTEIVYEILGHLFDAMFEKPLFNIMHCAMLRLFRIVIMKYNGCEDFLVQHKVRELIIEHLDKNFSYSGHLYEIAKLIIKAEDKEKRSESWKAFIEGKYCEMNNIIQASYGGKCPPRHKVEISDISIDGADAGFNTIDAYSIRNFSPK